MFGFIKKPVKQIAVRDTLFGDLPLEYWASIKNNETPWNLFQDAKRMLDKGDKGRTIEILKEIISVPALESRHYLQAWHFLKDLGAKPDGPIRIYGIVVEVGMPEGLDLLAVYADHSARYYNYSGKAIIWDGAGDFLKDKIDEILILAMGTVKQLGPWKDVRPPAPHNKMARVNFLTSHGLHFGEAAQSVLFNDPLAHKIMYAIMEVRDALISKSTGRSV